MPTPYDRDRSVSSHKDSGGYLDKAWANEVLRGQIKQIWSKRFVDHTDMVVSETRALIDMLRIQGFWWQSERLQNHLNRRLAVERKVRRSLRIYAEGASHQQMRASPSGEVVAP